MNKICQYLTCVFLSLNTVIFSASSLIVESNTLSDLLPYLDSNTLIVFDIDNTIIEPAQSLGSDQWAWNRLKDLKTKGLPEPEAVRQVSSEWQQIHTITKVKTLEENTPKLIKYLQVHHYPMMALTTRRPAYAQVTLRELHDVNIDFKTTSMNTHNHKFPTEKNIIYKEGILFITIEYRKGTVLKEFLQNNEYFPKKIIFVDDKLAHVKDVADACEQLDIDFVGIRYGAADAHVASFNQSVAEVQWKFMHHILSDEEAAAVITRDCVLISLPD